MIKNRSAKLLLYSIHFYFLSILFQGCMAPIDESLTAGNANGAQVASSLTLQDILNIKLTDPESFEEVTQISASAKTLTESIDSLLKKQQPSTTTAVQNTTISENDLNQTETTNDSQSIDTGIIETENSQTTPHDQNNNNENMNNSSFSEGASAIFLPLIRPYDITGQYFQPALTLDSFSEDQKNTFLDSLLPDDVELEFDVDINIEELKLNTPLFISLSSSKADEADYWVDGIEDNTEIQNALSEVYRAGGGMVFLFPGTYHIKKQLRIWDNVTLKGSGRTGNNRTVIRLTNNAPSMNGSAGIIRMKKDFKRGKEKRVKNTTIEDFVIDGNRKNQKQNVKDKEKKYGFYSEGDNITIRRISSINCMGYGFDPHAHEDTVPAKNLIIEDSYAAYNFLDGFTLDMLHDGRFENNIAEYNDRNGFNVITESEGIEFANNISRFNGMTGMKIQTKANSIFYVNNFFYGNDREGIYARNSDYNLFKNNYILNNGSYGLSFVGSRNNEFSNNVIAFNAGVHSGKSEILIEEYQGAFKGNPKKRSSLNNTIQNNLIISAYGKYVLWERDNTNGTNFNNNDIWFQTNGYIYVGNESISSNNSEYQHIK